MRSCSVVARTAFVAVLLTIPMLTGSAAQGGSTSVKRVEPHTRPSTMRITPLEASKWTEAQRQFLEPRGEGAQQAICVYNLGMCQKYWDFMGQITGRYTLPLRDKELLILRTAYLSRGNFVWGAHSTGNAKKAGMTAEEIARIAQGPDAKGWSSFDAALLRAADELHTSRFISNATWNALKERYDESKLVEAILTVGGYTALIMFHSSTGGPPLRPGMPGVPD